MENITKDPNVSRSFDDINQLFYWYDYVLTLALLSMSSGLGIYFGCFSNKEATAKEYLLAGKQMKVFPVVVSLILSHTSSSTLLGVPADVYGFGGTFIIASLSIVMTGFVTVAAYVPVYHELQITNTYEYLGLRFDNRMKKCATLLYTLAMFIHLAVITYAAALAFSAATGFAVNIVIPIMCAICIFYTSLGGIRALIWIDTIQFMFTFGILFVLMVMGINAYGGISNLWNTKPIQARMDIFDFSLDFTKRETVWALLVGFTTHWAGHVSIDPGCVQKFLSVSTLQQTKWVIILYGFGIASIKAIAVVMGLLLSATYADCDPFITQKIKKNDQMVPFYVLNFASKDIPGIGGLFIAGLITACLSTISGILNCLSGTIFAIFVKKRLMKKEKKSEGFTLKLLVVIIGLISMLLVYVVEKLGDILSIAIGVVSIAYGPLMGIFSLGLFFPTANSKGTFYGSILSFVAMSIIVTGNNYYKMTKRLNYLHKPISVESCDFFVNTTITTELINNRVNARGNDIFPIFKISFYWFGFIGSMICIIMGLILSYMTGNNKPPVSKKLLSPIIHPFLPKDPITVDFIYKGVEDARKQLSSADDEDEEVVQTKRNDQSL